MFDFQILVELFLVLPRTPSVAEKVPGESAAVIPIVQIRATRFVQLMVVNTTMNVG